MRKVVSPLRCLMVSDMTSERVVVDQRVTLPRRGMKSSTRVVSLNQSFGDIGKFGRVWRWNIDHDEEERKRNTL